MHIAESLRVFLVTFTLPGEAQMIDRITEQFARRFATCNSVGPLSDAGEWHNILHFLLEQVSHKLS
jgi:Sec7-like guanine-nucleotide exchange factor